MNRDEKLLVAIKEKIASDYEYAIKKSKVNLLHIKNKVSGKSADYWMRFWQEQIDSVESIKKFIEKFELINDNDDDLWQVAPFAGILSPKERWEALKQ